jgi:iron complex transport system ATP-binding protein
VVALLGENGSGKSTLLKLLAGLLPPASGELTLDGRPVGELSRREAARRIGYLPQSCEPLFPASALEMVLLGRTAYLGLLGAPRAADHAAARRALEETDTAAFADRDVREMSGGERQRVFLSRVLAGETDVLLLDEPAANLDPRHRFLVVRVLRRRATAGGLVVFSTHELDVAAAAADRVVLLREGRVVEIGPVRETLTAAALTRLFGVPAIVSTGPSGRPLVSLAGDERG